MTILIGALTKLLPYLLASFAFIGSLFAARQSGINAQKVKELQNAVQFNQKATEISQTVNALSDDVVNSILRKQYGRD